MQLTKSWCSYNTNMYSMNPGRRLESYPSSMLSDALWVKWNPSPSHHHVEIQAFNFVNVFLCYAKLFSLM